MLIERMMAMMDALRDEVTALRERVDALESPAPKPTATTTPTTPATSSRAAAPSPTPTTGKPAGK